MNTISRIFDNLMSERTELENKLCQLELTTNQIKSANDLIEDFVGQFKESIDSLDEVYQSALIESLSERIDEMIGISDSDFVSDSDIENLSEKTDDEKIEDEILEEINFEIPDETPEPIKSEKFDIPETEAEMWAIIAEKEKRENEVDFLGEKYQSLELIQKSNKNAGLKIHKLDDGKGHTENSYILRAKFKKDLASITKKLHMVFGGIWENEITKEDEPLKFQYELIFADFVEKTDIEKICQWINKFWLNGVTMPDDEIPDDKESSETEIETLKSELLPETWGSVKYPEPETQNLTISETIEKPETVDTTESDESFDYLEAIAELIDTFPKNSRHEILKTVSGCESIVLIPLEKLADVYENLKTFDHENFVPF